MWLNLVLMKDSSLAIKLTLQTGKEQFIRAKKTPRYVGFSCC